MYGSGVKKMSEMDKLEKYLILKGYRYKRFEETNVSEIMGEDIGRKQIVVYKDGKRSWDAICNYGSYGYAEGLLEIMGDIVDIGKDGDSVVGWLTAQDVINRLERGVA